MNAPAQITDEGLLKKTQNLRNRILDALTEDGTKIPTDPDGVGMLLEVMKDVDRTALSKLKITSDDANAAEDRLAAMTMARLGKQMGSNNPFEKDIGGGSTDDSRSTANPNLLPKITPVPGNCEIGIATETFDTFMAKMEPEADPRELPKKENYLHDNSDE